MINASIDEYIVSELFKAKGGFVSGDRLARELGLSRAGLWKHVSFLRKHGFAIDAVPGKGYKLLRAPDRVDNLCMRRFLETRVLGRHVVHMAEIDSTNDVAKRMAIDGTPEGTVVSADAQLKGRGRMGRRWVSPRGGIYMSVVLYPDLPPNDLSALGLAMAAAVVETVRNLGVEATVKWPNDVLVDGEKVAGVLTEMSAQQDVVEWVVIGVGVNVAGAPRRTGGNRQPYAAVSDFTPEEVSIAGLAAGILNTLELDYVAFLSGDRERLVRKWSQYCLTVGKDVLLESRSGSWRGKAVRIREDGALILRLENGDEMSFYAGDVTLRT